ncbi:MAG: heme exporter protein CcmD [Stenotrophobium sp.]
MSEWLNMGGYAGYVWSSFGVTALVLAWNLLAPRWRRTAILKELDTEE